MIYVATVKIDSNGSKLVLLGNGFPRAVRGTRDPSTTLLAAKNGGFPWLELHKAPFSTKLDWKMVVCKISYHSDKLFRSFRNWKFWDSSIHPYIHPDIKKFFSENRFNGLRGGQNGYFRKKKKFFQLDHNTVPWPREVGPVKGKIFGSDVFICA